MRPLVAIDAEIQALDRRYVMAQLNGASDTTRIRLYNERIRLVQEWHQHSGGLHDATGYCKSTVPSSHNGGSEPAP